MTNRKHFNNLEDHTNFPEEVDHEGGKESWLVQLLWIVPAGLLVGYILFI